MSKLICYCFGYSEKDIQSDAIKNEGQSSILKKIVEAKKKGKCECEEKNPKRR